MRSLTKCSKHAKAVYQAAASGDWTIQPDQTETDMLTVHTIAVLEDNYSYLIVCEDRAAVVDPGDAAPIRAALDRTGVCLQRILLTHHHQDHTAGAQALAAATGAQICAADPARVPGTEQRLSDGDRLRLGTADVRVLATPGHTTDHVCFLVTGDSPADSAVLFTGDTLFAGGCGRAFEGTLATLQASLHQLAALPGETRVYCGHEYTQTNYTFAAAIEPKNIAIAGKLADTTRTRQAGLPTVPTTLAQECRLNPFLRTADTNLCRALGIPGADPLRVFTALRERKDKF